ncbi:MAG: leucine-rich repeat domain-containing protein [Clostridium sp.]|nr:leucine-rich repeat domain-containing protein [Clostridium sp.]
MGKTKRLCMAVICLLSLSLSMVYSEVPVYAVEARDGEDGEDIPFPSEEEEETTEPGGSEEPGGGDTTEPGGGDTEEVKFTVEGDKYTAEYKVLGATNVSLIKFTLKENTELTTVDLEETVKGTVNEEENTYTVTQIENGAFSECSAKKYVVPSTVTTLVGNPFEAEDVVVLKKVFQMKGTQAEAIISFDSSFYANVKAVLICGDQTSVAVVKEICGITSEGDLPEKIIPIAAATEDTIADYGILALADGDNTTGLIREGNTLNTATLAVKDYVTEEAVSGGTLTWTDVTDGESGKPDKYTVTADMFNNNVTTGTYEFTYEKDKYVPLKGSVRLSNTLYTATEGDFTYKLELFENGEERTATLLSCTTEAAVTECSIPEKVTKDGKEYIITKIAKDAFSTLDKVNTYIIPAGLKNIEAGAFYDTSDNTIENRVVLLRMTADSLDKLPEIGGSYQKKDDKNNRFAMVFAPQLKSSYDQLRNKYGNLVGWSEEFLQVAVSNVLTEKLMYGGGKTMDTNVYYDPASGKNTMAYVNTTIADQPKYKDFLDNHELDTTVTWDGGKDQYVFNYAEGKQTFSYTINAEGYIGIAKTQQFDPQSASGYTYELKNGTLSVTGYKGTETELKIPAAEADAYQQYSVTAISSRALTDNNNYRKLTIPASVVSVEPDAFISVNYMEIVVEAGNPNYIAIDNFLYSADKTTLIAAPSASGHVSLPEGTVRLGNYAFAGCTRVLSIIIPSTVTTIGTTGNAYTFAWMRGLETIRFSNYNPSSVIIMGNHVLEGSSLREVYYPEGTTAAYTAVLQANGIYLNSDVKVYEWKPTYNTIVTMDGTEVRHINPADSTKTYTWTSSNPDVVIVEADGNQGKLTAVGNGEAVITATAADGTSYKWTVNVTLSETVYKTAFPVTGVTLGKKDGKKADQVTVNTISVPRGTQLSSVTVKNKKIATVKLSKDKMGVVITSAKKTGKTTVTVTDANGKTATLNVTVKKAPTKKNFKLAKSSVTLKKQQTYQIALKKSVACQKMTYTLSKAAKKIVSVDKTGLVTAKKKGTAKITVKSYNGRTATLTVKVK